LFKNPKCKATALAGQSHAKVAYINLFEKQFMVSAFERFILAGWEHQEPTSLSLGDSGVARFYVKSFTSNVSITNSRSSRYW
jgi:hypothetical protein